MDIANYSDRKPNPTMMTSSAKATLNGKPSAQKLSTYPSTKADNLRGGGVGNVGGGKGGTTIGATGASIKRSSNAYNPNRSYPVEIINKAKARIGGH